MNAEKKQWIAPQATEIEVNTGNTHTHAEYYIGSHAPAAS